MALSCPNAASVSPSPNEPSVSPRWKYDVFLSFRGEDTRKGFLSHLYHELQSRRGIQTFKDDQQLEKGTAISQNLLTAIEESRFAIVVLSQNYASSTWCLAELAKIFECMEDKNTILPIFYNVEPSDVRHQRGSFEVALAKHDKSGQEVEKVKQWRDALEKVAKISGWDSKNYKSERELVEDIVKSVQNSVLRKHISLGPYGSEGELQTFDDGVHSTVRQLVIHFIPKRLIKKSVICIQIQYVSDDGTSIWSDKHGFPAAVGSEKATVTLDYPEEFLTSIHGRYDRIMGTTHIISLTFKSNKRTFGPFGGVVSNENNFSIEEPGYMIVGFYGKSDDSFFAWPVPGPRAIGAHLKPI